MSVEELYCERAECERPRVGHGRYCELHTKREQRGQDMDAPVSEKLTPEGRMLEAAIAWVDKAGDDDDDYEAKKRSFKRSVKAWMKSLGWRPRGASCPTCTKDSTPQKPPPGARVRTRTRRHRFVQLELLQLPRPRAERGS